MELSSSLHQITGKVISVLENEASLQTEVGAEIDEIKLELKAITAFLEDADRRLGVVAPFRLLCIDHCLTTLCCHRAIQVHHQRAKQLGESENGPSKLHELSRFGGGTGELLAAKEVSHCDRHVWSTSL
ncbi:hypothetical protein HRI_003590600 [Hibiscus trionum]|uniref:Disease resistance N-terminal domain-containing protein n=1 Tax=Hibiscus trionum TaxID=183268 RepID=A0A9W7MEX9_HIBTR|nr:hypothetical protein HRI_003590600 [Hibiscus trionum]